MELSLSFFRRHYRRSIKTKRNNKRLNNHKKRISRGRTVLNPRKEESFKKPFYEDNAGDKMTDEDRQVVLTFDSTASKFVLDAFGKKVNKEGTIVEKDNPNQVVLTFEKRVLTEENFGGVMNGSDIFIEDNIVSLRKLKELEEEK